MGTCISKSRRKPTAHKECHFVQDKVVISQAPTTPKIVLPNKHSHSPITSPSSSSFSCTTSVTNSSCSSSTPTSSSSSSSVLVSKDRSFSNEFLWACIKENPHIVQVNPIKASPIKSVSVKFPAWKLESPTKSIVPSSKQSVQLRRNRLQQPKRECDNSPALTRQKSFRREFERPQSTSSLPRRNLSSPSPSRRFNGDVCRGIPANSLKGSCDRSVGLKTNAVNSISLSGRKENLRPKSPLNNISRDGSRLRRSETCTHHIQPENDQNSIGAVLSTQEYYNYLPIEDINNPLISLDCFIFL